MSAEQLQLRELLQRLSDAEIRFVLVGGLAVNAWGYLRTTRDVDVVPDPSKENLEKLDLLLRDLNGKVEVGERLLDADAISTFLKTGDRTLVATDLGHVDVLQGLPQVAMKRASDRPRDRDDLEGRWKRLRAMARCRLIPLRNDLQSHYIA